MTAAMSAGRKVYVSPHFDDIAFSLGAWVLDHPGGAMIDLFTRSAFTAREWKDLSPERIAEVSALRDAEDAAFAQAAGIERILLGAEEPALRGRRSFSRRGLADDIGQIRTALWSTLDARTAGDDAVNVFCPAGIGGHINHLATRAVVLDWIATAPSRISLCFYEDLPYAAHRRKRAWGILRLRAATRWRHLERVSWTATAAKLELVNLYPSQHWKPAVSLEPFTPAASEPGGPHEAVWVLRRQ